MSTRAYYHPRRQLIDLADLPRGLYDEIAGLRGQIPPPPAPPTLTTAGEIIPVSVGSQGEVVLAYKHARDIIDSCTYAGASEWRPTPKTPRHKEAAQRFSKGCERHPLDHSSPEEPKWPPCRRCGEPLYLLTSGRSLCEKCRLEGAAQCVGCRDPFEASELDAFGNCKECARDLELWHINHMRCEAARRSTRRQP